MAKGKQFASASKNGMTEKAEEKREKKVKGKKGKKGTNPFANLVKEK